MLMQTSTVNHQCFFIHLRTPSNNMPDNMYQVRHFPREGKLGKNGKYRDLDKVEYRCDDTPLQRTSKCVRDPDEVGTYRGP